MFKEIWNLTTSCQLRCIPMPHANWNPSVLNLEPRCCLSCSFSHGRGMTQHNHYIVNNSWVVCFPDIATRSLMCSVLSCAVPLWAKFRGEGRKRLDEIQWPLGLNGQCQGWTEAKSCLNTQIPSLVLFLDPWPTKKPNAHTRTLTQTHICQTVCLASDSFPAEIWSWHVLLIRHC